MALGGAAARVFAGPQHTCAALVDGSLRCWGVNAGGQLGYGTLSSVGDDETPAEAGRTPLFTPLNVGWYFENARKLEVWLMDESSDAQSSGVALFVKNGSGEPLSGWRALYTFNVAERPSATLGLQDHYTPWSELRLLPFAPTSTVRTLELDFGAQVLAPGQSTSWGKNGGEKLRLHFADWAHGWDSDNDYALAGRLRRNVWFPSRRVQLVGRDDAVLYGWNRAHDSPRMKGIMTTTTRQPSE